MFEEFGIPLDGVEFEDTYQDELGKSHELVEHAMDVILQLKQYHDLYRNKWGKCNTVPRLKRFWLDQHFKRYLCIGRSRISQTYEKNIFLIVLIK